MNDRVWSIWICRARSNLARAKHGKFSEDVLYEDLAFDAQQAAEKSLKALLLYLGMDAPRTHSIGYLLKLIEDGSQMAIPPHVQEAAVLSDYAVTTRYPGNYEAVSEEEYLRAVELADDVCSWVMSIIRQC
ncbi:MAG TPA: HEPN domain-containing protein [Bacillota bacterium]|nr:HEPN domain-containing protein [Bacillota bacterium]HOK70239.1 HEPN domain-containing protein [Bacillota bacterium]HPZ12885.1 HEPN domain-containing protein [Bacillota bacterium]HQD80349.1 HEPN domain-containing protein [Bacillota bacterium]